MHLNSILLFEKYAKPLFTAGMKVLEIGPDGFPSSYRKIVADETISWETLDIYASDKLTYPSTAEYSFPIPADTYDIVLSGQVIEHVKKIWVWTKEVARVCKPGGRVITINPVSWIFHEHPVDCWRIYPEGMKALYEDAGLEMQLSQFESLEPCNISSFHIFKQAIKRMIGREPSLSGPVIDTISIGIKKH
jgi:SAM-dependent methyltransferase